MNRYIIYKATNLINGKIYIGKTKHSLKKRIIQHKCCSLTKRTNAHIHNAILKYGIENFDWKEIDSSISEDQINEKEKCWIKFYKSNNRLFGYNMTDGGDGLTNPTPETREKIGRSSLGRRHSSKTKEQISKNTKGDKNPMFGKSHSEETREKIRKTQIGKKLSEEHKEKVRISNMNRTVSTETREKIGKIKAKYFELKSPTGKIYQGFNLTEFCRENKLNRRCICKVFHGKLKSYKGWTKI